MGHPAFAYKPQLAAHGRDTRTRELAREHKRRHRARALDLWGRVVAFAALSLALVLAYVGLTAALTAQTYRLSSENKRHAQLLQTTEELRERADRLQSLPRLQAAAAKLHMTEPSGYAIVSLPAPAPERKPVLSGPVATLTRWLGVR